MLDFRTKTEKKKYKEGCEHKSQNQLYFYRKYSRRREVKEAEAKRTTGHALGGGNSDSKGNAGRRFWINGSKRRQVRREKAASGTQPVPNKSTL